MKPFVVEIYLKNGDIFLLEPRFAHSIKAACEEVAADFHSNPDKPYIIQRNTGEWRVVPKHSIDYVKVQSTTESAGKVMSPPKHGR